MGYGIKKYDYFGVDASGHTIRGQEIARDQRDLAEFLSSKGIFLSKCTELEIIEPDEDPPVEAQDSTQHSKRSSDTGHRLSSQHGWLVLLACILGVWLGGWVSGPRRSVVKFQNTVSTLMTAQTRADVEKLLPQRLTPNEESDHTRYRVSSHKVVQIHYDRTGGLNQPSNRVIGLPKVFESKK